MFRYAGDPVLVIGEERGHGYRKKISGRFVPYMVVAKVRKG